MFSVQVGKIRKIILNTSISQRFPSSIPQWGENRKNVLFYLEYCTKFGGQRHVLADLFPTYLPVPTVQQVGGIGNDMKG